MVKSHAPGHTAGGGWCQGQAPKAGGKRGTRQMPGSLSQGPELYPGSATDLCHTTPSWASFALCVKGEGLNSNSKVH